MGTSFTTYCWKLNRLLNPRQSEEGWQQSNLVPRKVRPFFGLCNKVFESDFKDFMDNETMVKKEGVCPMK